MVIVWYKNIVIIILITGTCNNLRHQIDPLTRWVLKRLISPILMEHFFAHMSRTSCWSWFPKTRIDDSLFVPFCHTSKSISIRTLQVIELFQPAWSTTSCSSCFFPYNLQSFTIVRVKSLYRQRRRTLFLIRQLNYRKLFENPISIHYNYSSG